MLIWTLAEAGLVIAKIRGYPKTLARSKSDQLK
jgi:hypothetical protein